MHTAAKTAVLCQRFDDLDFSNMPEAVAESFTLMANAVNDRGTRARERPPRIYWECEVNLEGAGEPDYEQFEALLTLQGELLDFLDELHTKILYCFTANQQQPWSPNAMAQAQGFAESVMTELREMHPGLVLGKVTEAIARARFIVLPLMSPEDWEQDCSADELPTWALPSDEDRARIKSATVQLMSTDGGYPTIEGIRAALKYANPSDFDRALEDGPTMYLALANAPAVARFEIDEGPDSLSISAAYLPHASDIPQLLQCCCKVPRPPSVVTYSEAQGMGAPVLAGGLRFVWW